MKWHIGRVTVTKIVELEFTGGTRFILPQATREAVRGMDWIKPYFMNDEGQLIMSVHALVVQTPSRRIVVDTCIGNDKTGRMAPHWNHMQGPFLTDRATFMIISGGVNIYPQEAENLLITHPKVLDCAVIGVPNEEFGEEVKAVVQPRDMRDAAGPLAKELEAELIAFCRESLSPIKCPKSVDFEAELPRHPTGKLYKRLLRDRYWAGRASRII